VAETALALAPMPIEAQPTEYIRTAWADRPYGAIDTVHVAAAHDGHSAWVKLSFAVPSGPSDAPGRGGPEFADAAAVYTANGSGAPAGTIGAPDAPVEMVLWSADRDRTRALTGLGPGRFRPRGETSVGAAGRADGSRWAVVFTQPLEALRASSGIGVAVWDGTNEERAGIGSATPEWSPLTFDD